MIDPGGFFLDKRNQQLYIDNAYLPPVGSAERPLAGFCFFMIFVTVEKYHA
jgi:hypothetical protein